MIYGGIDGAVTTSAIVAGVAGSVPLLAFLLALPSVFEISVLAAMITVRIRRGPSFRVM